MIRPRAPGVRQEPPLPISVEVAPGAKVEGLAERIRARVRDKLLVTTEITLVARRRSAAQRIQVQTRRKSLRRRPHAKASDPRSASHHAGRRRSSRPRSTSGRACSACRSFSSSLISTMPVRATSISIPATTGSSPCSPMRTANRSSAAPRPTPVACITSRSTSRAPCSCRRSSGSARAGIPNTGVRDRMIFDAIYFEDPLGLLIELSCWKFDAPRGFTRSDVLFAAHNLRVARGDRAIMEVHIADAIENLVAASTKSLSADREPKDPYQRSHAPELIAKQIGGSQCLRSNCMSSSRASTT